MSPEQQAILQEIADKLAHHHTWFLVNFWGLQALLSLSICASGIAALLTATREGCPPAAAVSATPQAGGHLPEIFRRLRRPIP